MSWVRPARFGAPAAPTTFLPIEEPALPKPALSPAVLRQVLAAAPDIVRTKPPAFTSVEEFVAGMTGRQRLALTQAAARGVLTQGAGYGEILAALATVMAYYGEQRGP